MATTTLSKEQRILIIMRKVLAQIVKETTPDPGLRHPLSERTIEDIRECFALIAARERELADDAGIPQERPRYIDEPHTSTVVSLKTLSKRKTDKED